VGKEGNGHSKAVGFDETERSLYHAAKIPLYSKGGVGVALVEDHKTVGRSIVDIAGAAQNNGRHGRRPSSQPESCQVATCVLWGGAMG
jgi:hypothetical protein